MRASSLQFPLELLDFGRPAPRRRQPDGELGGPAVTLATLDGTQECPHLQKRVAQEVGVTVSVVDEALENVSPIRPTRPASRSSAGVT